MATRPSKDAEPRKKNDRTSSKQGILCSLVRPHSVFNPQFGRASRSPSTLETKVALDGVVAREVEVNQAVLLTVSPIR